MASISYQVRSLVLTKGFRYQECGGVTQCYGSKGTPLIINVKAREKFFVPTVLIQRVRLYLSNRRLKGVPIEDCSLIVPMVVSHSSHNSSTVSILKSLFRGKSYGALYKVISDQKTYTGCTGLIMEEDFTPLMMWGYWISVEDILSDGILNYSSRILDNGKSVYINPRLFRNTDRVSKYLSKPVFRLLAGEEDDSTSSIHVIIEDFSHMFYAPDPPRSYDYPIRLQDKLIEAYDNR